MVGADWLQIFLPLLLSVLELFTKDHRNPWTTHFENSPKPPLFYSARNVVFITAWVLATYATVSLSTDHSTYICPQAGMLRITMHTLQCLGLLLDAGIILLVSRMSRDGKVSGKRWGRLSQSALTTAGVSSIIACAILWSNPKYLDWSLRLDSKTILHLVFTSSLWTNFIASAVYLMGDLRPTTTVFTVSCVTAYIHYFVDSNLGVTVSPQWSLMFRCLSAFVAVLGYVRLEGEASKSQQYQSLNQSSSKALMTFCILLSAIFFWKKSLLYFTTNEFSAHPITCLISNARSTSAHWSSQAARSTSLEQAVAEYQLRYGILHHQDLISGTSIQPNVDQSSWTTLARYTMTFCHSGV
jgi:hypothetical protein